MAQDAQRIIREYWDALPPDDEVRTFNLQSMPVAGHNKKFRVESASGSWLVKFCHHDAWRVPEICRREAMVSLFGKLLDVPVVDAWVLRADLLGENIPELVPENELILDEFVLMPLLNGKSVEEDQEGGASRLRMQSGRVGDAFAFMHWIGDEDRGLADVMYEGERFLLIDNGLCGPGQGPKLRGYHPDPAAFSAERVVLKCYGGGKMSLVEFAFYHLEAEQRSLAEPSALQRITELQDHVIEQVVASLGINMAVATTLIQRKATITADYHAWFTEAITTCRRLAEGG